MSQNLPKKVAVVGLGYVGLHLASAFAKHLSTIGFDINEERIHELQRGFDRNGEVLPEALQSKRLFFTTDPTYLKEANFIIIVVPTPVDRAKRPDLLPLIEASNLVGRHMQRGTIVVYESTVYPGCTEEVCIPILEKASGFKAGIDFKVGYSPERVNPGDPEHTLENIVKVVAGQDPETTEIMAKVYGLVVKAGIYKAPNIRTAEAAKVIENIQRDINIALMNELAILFHSLGLDTKEVLNAARTKWNFLFFEPGLVGGHCIPVDPYYLTHKALEVGFHPEVILTGRKINDSMPSFIANETVKLLIKADKIVQKAEVLVLGATFKENLRDIRNSGALELVRKLQEFGCQVFVHDPLVETKHLKALGFKVIEDPFSSNYKFDALVLAVPHRVFRELPLNDYLKLLKDKEGQAVVVDLKGILSEIKKLNLPILYWKL